MAGSSSRRSAMAVRSQSSATLSLLYTRLLFLGTCILLLPFAGFLYLMNPKVGDLLMPASRSGHSSLKLGNEGASDDLWKESVILNSTKGTLAGAEAVWQIPDNPKAAVFFAHGCTHRATHFWDRNANCPECIGLPEDRALVIAALQRGYAVLALSSSSVCWQSLWPPESSDEVRKVSDAIETWRNMNGLNGLPIAALGASSGGYFVSILAHLVDFSALAVVIASGITKAYSTPLKSGKAYPPTLFLHMPKDEDTAERVQIAVGILRKRNVQAAELPCLEVPITLEFFSERIVRLDVKTSMTVYRALQEGGVLDERGRLMKDGRSFDWEEMLRGTGILQRPEYSRFMWKQAIEEELNLAFAYHEMTSLNSSIIFDWFDGVCRTDGSSVAPKCGAYHM